MKLLPIPLSPLSGPPLGMWSSDLLWRYPAAPPSPLADLKTQLPSQLSSDPRLWGREEVIIFLRWTEHEFDLPKFELDLFQMNGKALCLLTKNDLNERCPNAGDIIHNVLQLLIRDAQMLHRHLPSSPITPTNRYPLSPHTHPPTPNWTSALPGSDNPFYASHLQHFLNSNSVTLSPAPSLDSQAGSPPSGQQETAVSSIYNKNDTTSSGGSDMNDARSSSASGSDSARNSAQPGTSSGSSSHHSDSEEENSNGFKHKIPKLLPPPIHHKAHSSLSHHASKQQNSPILPSPNLLQHQHHSQMGIDYKQHNIFFNSQMDSINNSSGSSSASPSTPTTPHTPGYLSVKREFFPDTPTEPNTSNITFFISSLMNTNKSFF
jgi:ETS translocation variant 6/7